MKKITFVILAIALALPGIIALIALPTKRQELEMLVSETRGLPAEQSYKSVNPHTDIKMFIFNTYPDLVEQADEIIKRQGVTVNNGTEYMYLTYYLYMLDRHEELIELSGKNGDAIRYLSFLYLLPAFLYERLGFSDLAVQDYTRFLLGVRTVIESGESETFYDPFLQHKISIARLRRALLKQSMPVLRESYYTSSYFSTVLNNFFDGITEKRFLAAYRKRNIVKPVPLGFGRALEFDHRPLHQIASKYTVHDVPFIAYELYAAAHNWKCTNPDQLFYDWDCTITSNRDMYAERADSISTANQPFLAYMYRFRKARFLMEQGANEEAIAAFEEVKQMPFHPDLEFLRDDAFLFPAFTYLQMQDYRKAEREFIRTTSQFSRSVSDAKNAAEAYLSSFDLLIQPLSHDN